eukprot:5429247-Amphidinium_carterae.1
MVGERLEQSEVLFRLVNGGCKFDCFSIILWAGSADGDGLTTDGSEKRTTLNKCSPTSSNSP